MKITINRKDLKSEHHIDTPLIDLALNDEALKSTVKLLFAIMNDDKKLSERGKYWWSQ